MSGKIIAVGALGGSGTRAVADVLMALGGFFGDDINESRDNLTFTRLFKDPEWFACAEKNDIQRRLEVFQNYMCGNLSISDLMLFIKASSKNGIMKNEPPSFKLLGKHFFCNQVIDSFWGWKEPNTHIYIDSIIDCMSDVKYIHVLRNGLDMAFSKNKQQLMNWGSFFGVEVRGDESDDEMAYKQLEYWIATTKKILSKKEKYKDRILVLNHAEFCISPEVEINKLAEYSGVNMSSDLSSDLYSIPDRNAALPRYRDMDTGIFDSRQIEFVKSQGFGTE